MQSILKMFRVAELGPTWSDFEPTEVSVQFALEFGFDKFEVLSYFSAGSTYITGAPGNDDDWFILVPDLTRAKSVAHADSRLSVSDLYGQSFDGKVLSIKQIGSRNNFIFVSNADMYIRIAAATELSKKLNLSNKRHRIDIMDVISNNRTSIYPEVFLKKKLW